MGRICKQLRQNVSREIQILCHMKERSRRSQSPQMNVEVSVRTWTMYPGFLNEQRPFLE
jgi:hypothetical protein